MHNILQHLTVVLNDNYDDNYNYDDNDDDDGYDDDNVTVLVWHVGLCLS